MKHLRRLLAAIALPLAAFLVGTLSVPASWAQAYPAKPVRIIVPWPPGAALDTIVRAMANDLTARWNQPVLVDNRAGAGSTIGAAAAAQASPDGYTLMATPINPTVVASRFMYKALPFDPDRSFAPISLLAQSSQVIVVHPSIPANSLRELIELARRQPQKLNYGSWGDGSQPNLVFELIKKRENVSITHVPYKGIAPVVTAAIAGEIQLTTGSPGTVAGLVKAGKLKPISVAGPRHAPELPGVPTVAESGYPYAQATVRFGLFAPAGTPAAVIERIHRDVVAVLRTPAFTQKYLTANGFQLVASGPDELAAAIREDVALVGEMIRAAGIKPE